MPTILYKSVHILSDAGLGMAMFSLGKSRLLCLFGIKLHIYTDTYFSRLPPA